MRIEEFVGHDMITEDDYDAYTRSYEWDIFDLDDDVEWSHLQIMNRLKVKGIECVFADMWHDDMAFILGCNAKSSDVASALGLHEDAVYNDFEHCMILLNLFQEKYLRGLV